jgi:hypothetical protein
MGKIINSVLRICLFGLKYYGTGFMEPHWDHNNVFGWSSSSSKNFSQKESRQEEG